MRRQAPGNKGLSASRESESHKIDIMRKLENEDEYALAEVFYHAWVQEIEVPGPPRPPTPAEMQQLMKAAGQKVQDALERIKVRHMKRFAK